MNDIKQDHQRLLANLKLLQKLHTKARLCELLGISSATWTNRMKQPWRTFSYDDFRAISKYCKIDLSQLIEGTLKIS
jgi:hypothetical protein